MQTKIEFSQVLEDIYAVAALSTLMPESEAAFFHPDHAQALTRLIRQAMAWVLVTAPQEAITLKSLADDGIVVEISDDTDEAEALELLSAVLSRAAINIVRTDAGRQPLPIPSLAVLAPNAIPSTITPHWL